MPTITVYIKASDVETIKRARLELKVSLSSVFVEAVRKKLDRQAKKAAVNGRGRT